MPKTKKHHAFSRTSGGQFVKNKSSDKNIEENVKFIESESESGETGSNSEQGDEEAAMGENYSDQESDRSTNTESGKGLGSVET